MPILHCASSLPFVVGIVHFFRACCKFQQQQIFYIVTNSDPVGPPPGSLPSPLAYIIVMCIGKLGTLNNKCNKNVLFIVPSPCHRELMKPKLYFIYVTMIFFSLSIKVGIKCINGH